MLDLNKELDFPMLPQRIAVISSATAAGYGDFSNQLERNPYGLVFYLKLFPAIMQGERVEESIIAALDRIYAEMEHWDAVVIIRGGGATSDLSGFDSYDLAANCAQFPLPIITGIGHERDDTVIDSVVHTRVKTPTAAAEFLISCMYESALMLEDYTNRIIGGVEVRMEREKHRLERLTERIPMTTNMYLQRGHFKIETIWQRLETALQHKMIKETHRLSLLEHRVMAASPEHLLKKGYSITMLNGKAVTDASTLKKGDRIVTMLHRGKIESEIK